MPDILGIDFETFYTKVYSLSKMTTQEYVFSPYFEIIGVSVKHNDTPPQWFTGTKDQTTKWLQQFPWEDSIAYAHNAQFDGMILERILDIHPKQWFCTMFAARPIIAPFNKGGRVSLAKCAEYLELPPKGTAVQNAIGFRRADFSPTHMTEYADYCKHDTVLAHRLYEYLSQRLPASERALIHETVIKVTRPRLMFNRDILTRRLTRLRGEKDAALAAAMLVDADALMSNPKFAVALETLGVVPPTKISLRTGLRAFAFAKTDPGFKALLEHPDFRVQALVAARLKLKSTLEETRLEKFIRLADLKVPVSIPLTYYGAHTGRFSGSGGLNFQNLPRGGELRQALEAPPGYKVVAADLSQIEARITACLAEEHALVAAFTRGDDVYSLFASQLYGRTITKADDLERFIGKTCILGLGYGMGWEKLQASVKALRNITLPDHEAKHMVSTYRRTYPGIPKVWGLCDMGIDAMADECAGTRLGPVSFLKGRIRLPNGMSIFYPELQHMHDGHEGWEYKYRNGVKSLWGGGVTENIVQALAKIVVATAELALSRRGLHAQLQIHDELLYCVREEVVPQVVEALGMAMRASVPFMPDLVTDCEVKVGDNYAAAK